MNWEDDHCEVCSVRGICNKGRKTFCGDGLKRFNKFFFFFKRRDAWPVSEEEYRKTKKLYGEKLKEIEL